MLLDVVVGAPSSFQPVARTVVVELAELSLSERVCIASAAFFWATTSRA
jgi:hypothetical protein